MSTLVIFLDFLPSDLLYSSGKKEITQNLFKKEITQNILRVWQSIFESKKISENTMANADNIFQENNTSTPGNLASNIWIHGIFLKTKILSRIERFAKISFAPWC